VTRKERYEVVLAWFEEHMPVAETELHYSTPFELLVAVILSAQCTDKRVNMITPRLFKQYPTAEIMARAEVEDIFELIRSVSYPNSKAKYLVSMAKMLVEQFGGEVPEEREQLMKLPGVGRKTANVIAAVVYHRPTMAVDTHVFRVANRIGLTTNAKTPLETELTLINSRPEVPTPKAHHWLILHGRYICVARKPHCWECGLAPYCRYFAAQERKKKRETQQKDKKNETKA